MASFSYTSAVIVLGLGLGTAVHLDPDDLAYVQTLTPHSSVVVEATDGAVLMRAVGARLHEPLKCTVSHDQAAIAQLLSNKNLIIEQVGEAAIRYLRKHCAEVHQLAFQPRARRSVLDLPFPPEKTGLPRGAGNSLLIVPGTKWCGESNVASSYDDLGTFHETDACCRAHDQCPYFIDAFQLKYNYQNKFPWTLSLCDCDAEFYRCLKKVKGITGHEVGKGFFGVLDVECFTFKTVEYCSEYHWSKLWCKQNATGPAAVVQKLGLHW